MQVLALLALIPMACAIPANPYHQPAAYTPAYHQPATYHQPAAYHHPAPAYNAYEHPKHNCSVLDVVEAAEVCTPALKTECAPVDLARKNVIDVEQCYPVTRTVCTESIELIDNEVCSYSYQPKTVTTTAKTVEVSFVKECKTQMVTVCAPAATGYGYGHQGYGHNYCNEVAQETCYNVPVVTPVEPEVEVTYPEPIKTCVNKPISLPRISCEDLTEEKCITVPEVEDVTESVEKCVTALDAPACQAVELTLPKQVCVELVYGHAENTHEAPEAAKPYHA